MNSSGFVNIWGFSVNPMGIFFTVVVALVLCFFYAGQKSDSKFNIWDAFMSEGKTSMVSILFFGTWIVTSWVILDRQMKGTLDSAFYQAYVLAWVSPLLVRLGGKAIAAARGKGDE